MEEESKNTKVPVTVEQEAESFTRQILKEILPNIYVPDHILTLIGTVSILYNRIRTGNFINFTSQLKNDKFPIKMDDKYLNKKVL